MAACERQADTGMELTRKVKNMEWAAFLNPRIVYGYWRVKRSFRPLRWLGRLIHNRRIYWLGFQVQWQPGLNSWKWYGGFESANSFGTCSNSEVTYTEWKWYGYKN